MADESATIWHDAIVGVLHRTQLAQPDELPEQINAAVQVAGLDVTVYLVDHEQRLLHPLPERGKPTPPSIAVDVLLRDQEPTDQVLDLCETLVGLLGHLVATKMPYGDRLHQAHRSQRWLEPVRRPPA